MIYVLTSVFWLSSLLVVYPYVVYPLLLRLLARRRYDDVGLRFADSPHVTMIISAYNEEAVIGAKLENTLRLSYPPDRLEVIVVSDASTDRTDAIVQELSHQHRRVRLLRQDERRGKSAGLNRAVASAQGEIIVFSDANAMYESGAIAELVGGFADPRVGYVVGAALYRDADGSAAAESEGLYWKLEMALKRLESDYDSVVGGDGAIYATRRQLFRELKYDDISDFVNPLQAIAAGYRGVFNSQARCFENAGDTFEKEFGRKRRIVNRTWRAVRRYGGLLRWRDHGRFIFMLVSHKVIRWFALPLIALAWVANTALLGVHGIYTASWLLITGSVVLAMSGAVLDRFALRQPRLVSIAYYFYFVNLAGLLGIWDEWRGVRHATWDHVRKREA